MKKPAMKFNIEIGDSEIRRLISTAMQNNENLGQAFFQFKDMPDNLTLYNIKTKKGGDGCFDLVCGKTIYRLLIDVHKL